MIKLDESIDWFKVSKTTPVIVLWEKEEKDLRRKRVIIYES